MFPEVILDQSFWAKKLSAAMAKTYPGPLLGWPFITEAVLAQNQKGLQAFI